METTTINKTGIRILDTEYEILEYTKKKVDLARFYVYQCLVRVNEIKDTLSKKYNIVSIDSNNIFFTNDDRYTKTPIGELNAKCIVEIVFDKEYSHLQYTRMLDLVGITGNYFNLIGGEYDHYKGRHTKSVNSIKVELYFNQKDVTL
jgi:hypothetical protein